MLDVLLTSDSHLPSREMQGWGKEMGEGTGQMLCTSSVRALELLTYSGGVAHTQLQDRVQFLHHIFALSVSMLVCLVGRRTEGTTG